VAPQVIREIGVAWPASDPRDRRPVAPASDPRDRRRVAQQV